MPLAEIFPQHAKRKCNICTIFCVPALATLKPQAGITAGSYAPAAPQPVSIDFWQDSWKVSFEISILGLKTSSDFSR